jgi:hypothetical protein
MFVFQLFFCARTLQSFAQTPTNYYIFLPNQGDVLREMRKFVQRLNYCVTSGRKIVPDISEPKNYITKI